MNSNITIPPLIDNVFRRYTITGSSNPNYKIKIVFDPNALDAEATVEVWGGTSQSPVLINSFPSWIASSWDSWYPINPATGTNVRYSEVLYVKIKMRNFSNSLSINFTWTEEWMA